MGKFAGDGEGKLAGDGVGKDSCERVKAALDPNALGVVTDDDHAEARTGGVRGRVSVNLSVKKEDYDKAPTRVSVKVKVSVKKRLMPKLRPGTLDTTNHAFKP